MGGRVVSRDSRHRAALLAVATLGFGLHLRAWFLLGPHLVWRFGAGPRAYMLLMSLPLLVAALARLPVGVLTDRYGVRVMFPAVSLVAAAAVLGLGGAGSLPAAVVAGGAAGLSGAAFVVGASLVARAFPYGRRGLALGVFSLGTVVAVAISVPSWRFDAGGRWAALVLGVLLVGFAGLAALVFRDAGVGSRAGSPVRRCVEMVRLASRTSLPLLYALALGSVVAIAVYLPVYLVTAFGLDWRRALTVTGAVITVAGAARLAGGWWTDRLPTARLLTACYGVAAGLCLVVALEPWRWWLTAAVIAVVAVCDGVASGALLALIGKAARPDSAGAVLGVTGAAAALGGLLLPLLLAGVDRLSRSYATAWTVLAAMLLAAAVYVKRHGLRVGLGLAVRFEPEHSPTAMTVAVVGESDTRLGAPAVVARLAELAASDELVVVYGSDASVPPRTNTNVLVTGLRDRLPRHSVVAVRMNSDSRGRLAVLLGEFVETGTVTIAVTPTADLRDVAAAMSSYLHADRVLTVSFTPAAGADLHEVWSRG